MILNDEDFIKSIKFTRVNKNTFYYVPSDISCLERLLSIFVDRNSFKVMTIYWHNHIYVFSKEEKNIRINHFAKQLTAMYIENNIEGKDKIIRYFKSLIQL